MKLIDLTCPQCGGFLNQEGDKFYCSSCGASFGIDYDEEDVEYQKLITEADRTRLMIEKDRELLETEYKLRKEYEENESRLKGQYAAKSFAGSALSSLILYLVTGGFTIAIMAAMLIFVVIIPLRESDKERLAEYEVKCQEFDLTEEQVLSDVPFLYNLEAAAKRKWNPFIRDTDHDYKQNREAVMISEPQAYRLYVLRMDYEYPVTTRNRVYLVLKATYQYTDNEEIKDSYYCVSFQNVKMNAAGRIECDYDKCFLETSGTSNGFHGFSEVEQLYREEIGNQEHDEIREVDVSEITKEG